MNAMQEALLKAKAISDKDIERVQKYGPKPVNEAQRRKAKVANQPKHYDLRGRCQE